MANTYFQFKKFLVKQEHAAMRVSTDACLFGAWIRLHGATKVLDIGTGTGLLSLMLAQRFPDAHFTAVEVEPGACVDAVLNFHSSPWKSRLELQQQDVRIWQPERVFDAIVCNPPFFMNDMPNPRQNRKLARHGQDGLSLEALIQVVNNLLQVQGKCYVMLPPQVMGILLILASKQGLFLQERCRVKHNSGKAVHLEFAVFSRERQEFISEEEIVLKDGDNFSRQAVVLLSPYYLFLHGESAQ